MQWLEQTSCINITKFQFSSCVPWLSSEQWLYTVGFVQGRLIYQKNFLLWNLIFKRKYIIETYYDKIVSKE